MDSSTHPVPPDGTPEERPALSPEVHFERERENCRIVYARGDHQLSYDGRPEHSEQALRTAVVITAMLTTVGGPTLLMTLFADHAPWEATVTLAVCLMLLPLFYVLYGTRRRR
jgi:hypothetical protein